MTKKLKNIVLSVIATLALIAPAAVPVAVSAATTEPNIDAGLCAGGNLTVSDTDCDPAATGAEAADTVDNIIATVINIFSLVVGVISVIMIIIGGLKYITSGGDSGNVSGAKNTILYAIIGLVVVALAQVIVRFVIGRVSES